MKNCEQKGNSVRDPSWRKGLSYKFCNYFRLSTACGRQLLKSFADILDNNAVRSATLNPKACFRISLHARATTNQLELHCTNSSSRVQALIGFMASLFCFSRKHKRDYGFQITWSKLRRGQTWISFVSPRWRLNASVCFPLQSFLGDNAFWKQKLGIRQRKKNSPEFLRIPEIDSITSVFHSNKVLNFRLWSISPFHTYFKETPI